MAINWGSEALDFGTGLLSKGIDFGFGVASSQQQAKLQRKLRRTEYQDMMHSMRTAGLNPMLAAGATPGHSAISAPSTGGDMQSNISSAAESRRRYNLNAPEKALLQSQQQQADALRDKALAERDSAIALRDHQVANLQAQARLGNATAGWTEGPNTAATWGLAELRGQQVKTEGLQQTLLGSQNITEGMRAWATANQALLSQADTFVARARERLIRAQEGATSADQARTELENTARAIEAEWLEGPVGGSMRRIGLGAGEVLDVLERVLALPRKTIMGDTDVRTEHYDAAGKPKGATRTRTRHRQR